MTSRLRSVAPSPGDLRSSGQKHQVELAKLHLVAVGQRRRFDRLVVDVDAVEAADVNNLDIIVLQ